MLPLAAFNPAPVESLQLRSGQCGSPSSTRSPTDPYTVQSYTPARSITYVRNPAWKASSDPIRKAYVDKIVVTETGNQATGPAGAADQHGQREHGVRRVPAARRPSRGSSRR